MDCRCHSCGRCLTEAELGQLDQGGTVVCNDCFATLRPVRRTGPAQPARRYRTDEELARENMEDDNVQHEASLAGYNFG